MRLVEAVPEAGLFALLDNWPNLVACHIGHQQLYGVGADINDRAADGLHGEGDVRFEGVVCQEQAVHAAECSRWQGRRQPESRRSVKLFLMRLSEWGNAPRMKRTPLYAVHQRLGGKLIEFGGWEMPVQYTSITD